MSQIDKLNDYDRTAVTAVMYNLIFMNEIAISSMFDTMDLIEHSPYYRHKTKYWIGIVRNEMRTYNKLLDKRTGGHISFLADLNDDYEDKLQMDLWKLRNVCKNALTRAHIGGTDIIVSLYVSGTLVAGACHNNDHSFDGFPHLRQYQRSFRWMRLTKMENAFIHMVNEVNKELRVEYQGLLDDDNDVQNGFKALANKLHDADSIIDTCNEHASKWEEENGEEDV